MERTDIIVRNVIFLWPICRSMKAVMSVPDLLRRAKHQIPACYFQSHCLKTRQISTPACDFQCQQAEIRSIKFWENSLRYKK